MGIHRAFRLANLRRIGLSERSISLWRYLYWFDPCRRGSFCSLSVGLWERLLKSTQPFSEGTLKSIEGFEPKLDFKLTHGHDWFRMDADKKHGRASIAAMLIDAEGRSIRLIIEGVVELNEATASLLFGHPDAKTCPFGYAVEQVRFECGHESYKEIENMMFAGSLRFIKEGDELFANAHISRIIAGSGYE